MLPQSLWQWYVLGRGSMCAKSITRTFFFLKQGTSVMSQLKKRVAVVAR